VQVQVQRVRAGGHWQRRRRDQLPSLAGDMPGTAGRAAGPGMPANRSVCLYAMT